jgi:hypothetical protein
MWGTSDVGSFKATPPEVAVCGDCTLPWTAGPDCVSHATADAVTYRSTYPTGPSLTIPDNLEVDCGFGKIKMDAAAADVRGCDPRAMTLPRTFTADDGCDGALSPCQTIVFVDTTNPILIVSQSYQDECNGSNG